MVTLYDTATIKLWNQTVGAVSWLPEEAYAVFEYDPTFLNKGWDISPVMLGVEEAQQGNRIFSFPTLNQDTYLGLPGLLADSLPDKFGNAVIDAWLARTNRDIQNFSPVQRLCYTGKRAMGALEYFPPVDRKFDRTTEIEVAQLVDLAQSIMHERSKLDVHLSESNQENAEAMLDILKVGTSAGGARPKAIIAIDQNDRVILG